MKVIVREDISINSTRGKLLIDGNLTPGKEYKVVGIDNEFNLPIRCKYKEENFYIPKEAKFLIVVLNNKNESWIFWNDYFLSTEEMRDGKIDTLLE